MKIEIRSICPEDLKIYQYWKLPQHQYHQSNGPYFKKHSDQEIIKEIEKLSLQFKNGSSNPLPLRKMIVNEKNELIGEVSSYWKSIETYWMEIGIVIFSESNWGKGIGQKALTLWINELFNTRKQIVRLGISTWSGNLGMIYLAKKLGMIKEAEYRKARIVKGEYFDSISYGILKNEWVTNLNTKSK